VHELESALAIRSLDFTYLSGVPSDDNAVLLVLAATSNPVRLYKFLGGPTFEALFSRHRDLGSGSFQDLGG
jgi:hypothetical protein